MSKEMLDEKNGELARRRYQIEDELEKRKNIFDAEDITPEDIKEFIVQYVEDVQNDYDQSDDEFKRIMINTFVERVDVSKEKVTVHIHTPFSRMDRGYNGNFTGVLHRLSTVKLTRSFPRKKNIHGRLDWFSLTMIIAHHSIKGSENILAKLSQGITPCGNFVSYQTFR